MSVAGIIAEYNPFHYGHAHHIALTRKETGADGIVVVMSGHVVQRGDFAFFSKWTRAEAAVRGGADLVIELPVTCSLRSAEGFAAAGVSLLDNLGICDFLSFGSECGQVLPLVSLAKTLNQTDWLESFREYIAEGLPFPAARALAIEKLCGPDASTLLSSPNNTLGIEYCKAIENLSSPMEPFTIAREGVSHHGEANGKFASASFIRSQMLKGENMDDFVPSSACSLYEKELSAKLAPCSVKRVELALLSHLRRFTADNFAALADVTEGLENRLVSAVQKATSLTELMNKLKTKRYTYTRLSRILLSAFLDLSAEDIALMPAYIRVLALNSRGAELLNEIKEKSSLPILTKPAEIESFSQEARRIFEAERKAGDLFALSSPIARPCGMDFTTSPRFIS